MGSPLKVNPTTSSPSHAHRRTRVYPRPDRILITVPTSIRVASRHRIFVNVLAEVLACRWARKSKFKNKDEGKTVPVRSQVAVR